MKTFSAVLATLLFQGAVMATQFDYETSALIGGGFPEPDFSVKNQFINAFEIQFNALSIAGIKPELAYMHSYETDYRRVDGATTYINRVGLNGVYEMPMDHFTPFAKAGAGYEFISKHYDGYRDGAYLNAGVGAKYALSDAWSLKLEAIYLVKHRDEPNYKSDYDNNGIVLAGINYSFGAKPEPVKEEPAPTPAPVVAAPAPVAPLDSDKDGVIDPNDKCPNTPTWATVDADGCPIKRTLRINFPFDSAKIPQQEKGEISDFAAFLKKEQYNVNLIGHTDSTGAEAYNQKLSEKRAASVKKALQAEGIEESRLSSAGRGESQPLVANDTKAHRAENRRVEAEITLP